MSRMTCRVCGVECERKTSRQLYCSTQCKERGKPSHSSGKCSDCGKAMQIKGGGAGRCNACRGVQPAIRRSPRTSPGEVTHGMRSMYQRGCRCDACREASAAYMRDYAVRTRERTGLNPNTLSRRKFRDLHGYWPQDRREVPAKTRRAVYERDGWVCQICGEAIRRDYEPNSGVGPSLDHIVPQSSTLVPDDSIGNLRMVHMLCNTVRWDGSRSDDEVRDRVKVLLDA